MFVYFSGYLNIFMVINTIIVIKNANTTIDIIDLCFLCYHLNVKQKLKIYSIFLTDRVEFLLFFFLLNIKIRLGHIINYT